MNKTKIQHSLIQQINQWETDSIEKIKQTAEETRQTLLKHTKNSIDEIEIQLENLTQQLRQSRQENNFTEISLHQWNQQLKELQQQLINPVKINIGYHSTSFIHKIYADIFRKLIYSKIRFYIISNKKQISTFIDLN